MLTGEVKNPEPDFAHEKALAQAIVTALGEFISVRTQDLPHRFKAPASFAQYMADWGTNSTYRSMPIMGSNSSNYMTIDMTTRPTQHIFEMTFTGADGMRLFTLEIEYGDAVKEVNNAMKMQYL
jgi:hypothetical protein